MSAGRRRSGKRKPVPPKKRTPKADTPSVSPRRRPSGSVSARSILDECIGAVCLVEVSLHSLDSREIGHPEQEVLKRALKLMWSVHEWIDDSNRDALDDDDDGEDES